MNENHAKLMPSPEWAAHIQDEVLPQATAGVELGTDLLELGPGPGAATAFLTRLQAVGFAAITLHVSYNLVFTARKASVS
jgi:hypothetical protein